jgi:hypothetical protein
VQFFQGLRHPWDGHDDHSHGHGHEHEVFASDPLSSLSNMLLLVLLMNLNLKKGAVDLSTLNSHSSAMLHLIVFLFLLPSCFFSYFFDILYFQEFDNQIGRNYA